MDASIKNAVYDHAESVFPREACGLLIDVSGEVRYYPCRNIATGNDHFALCPEDYAEAESIGSIVAVVHSHPNGPAEPSQADRVACEASGLPWHIVAWPLKEWAYIEPNGYKAPLIGRVFAHGVLDCYALIRDWYKEERGIDLPDFARTDEWWKNGGNLYLDNFSKAGFYRVDDELPQPGDVLLMQILADVPNHAAIFLEGNIILHHLYDRLSCKEIWGGYYKKHTVAVLRYGNQT